MASTPEPVAEQTRSSCPTPRTRPRPGHLLRALEWRTGLEYLSARLAMRRIAGWPHGDGHPVLVMPGFLAGPPSTELLRNVLRQLGYRVYDWGLGYNMGYRASMKEALPARLHHIRERTDGRRVSIIGWSAGGIYARELARAFPDDVRSVITLGSPFRGNHEASTAWKVWRLVNRGGDAAEAVSEPRWGAANNRCRCRRPASTANRTASWPGSAAPACPLPRQKTSKCAAATSDTVTTCRRCR